MLVEVYLSIQSFIKTQVEEGRERWQARLDSLREECSTERATTRDKVARLAAKSEQAEEAARAAAGTAGDRKAALRAALEAELFQVKNMDTATLRARGGRGMHYYVLHAAAYIPLTMRPREDGAYCVERGG